MKPNRKSRMTDWSRAALASAVVAGLLSSCHHDRPPPTAAEEEQDVVRLLERSGSIPKSLENILEPKVNDLWGATFERGLGNLGKKRPEDSDLVKIGSVSCFTAGCMVKLWFKDRVVAGIFEDDLLIGSQSPLHKWPGRIYRGPFIEEGGQGAVHPVRTTWALMVDPPRYRELIALSTVPHAFVVPDRLKMKMAVSDLPKGEP